MSYEVSLLPGVHLVVVDLEAQGESRMSVTGTELIAARTVGLAAAEAGFEMHGVIS